MDSLTGRAYGSRSNDSVSNPGSVRLGLGPGYNGNLGHSDLDLACPNYGSARFLALRECCGALCVRYRGVTGRYASVTQALRKRDGSLRERDFLGTHTLSYIRNFVTKTYDD